MIFLYKSDPNTDKGEGVKKSEIFVDIINGSPLFPEVQPRFRTLLIIHSSH